MQNALSQNCKSYRKSDLFGDLLKLEPWVNSNLFNNNLFSGSGFQVDIKESPNSVEISADLPGVKKEDISISIEDNVLSIQANRNEEKNEETNAYVRRERKTGSMTRSFSLNETLDTETVSAELADGVLRVTVKKVEKCLPKKIPVK